MDTNFQTSFIPKKPLTVERSPRSARMSFATFIASLVFFISLASFGGLYLYKQTLTKTIADKNASLEAARNSFEPALISELQRLNHRIDSSNILLAQHVSISPIFNSLQISTLKSVQFTKFSYTLPNNDAGQTNDITINMSGKARDYTNIALESDEIAKNKDIHNPIFSNLTLDEHTGVVSFDLVFTVSPSLVQYANHIPDSVLNTIDTSTTSDTMPSVPPSDTSTTPPATSTTPATPAGSTQAPLIHAGTQPKP